MYIESALPNRPKFYATPNPPHPSIDVAFKDMYSPRPRLLLLTCVCAAFAADPPPKPQDAKKPGAVVVIDPATGKIRQPTDAEIGALSPASPAPKAPQSTVLLQGPAGAVGAMAPEDSMSYMVVTTTPQGKLAMDCVTGSKAAAAAVTPAPKKANDPKAPR